jgi:hypothetical protein
MLPPSLINMDVEDLKALCLDHLVGTVHRTKLVIFTPRVCHFYVFLAEREIYQEKVSVVFGLELQILVVPWPTGHWVTSLYRFIFGR